MGIVTAADFMRAQVPEVQHPAARIPQMRESGLHAVARGC